SRAAPGGMPVTTGWQTGRLLGLELTEDVVVGHDRHSVDFSAISYDDEPDGERETTGTDVIGDEPETRLIQRVGPAGRQGDLDTADVLEERRGTGLVLAFAGYLSDLRERGTGGRTAAREPVAAIGVLRSDAVVGQERRGHHESDHQCNTDAIQVSKHSDLLLPR